MSIKDPYLSAIMADLFEWITSGFLGHTGRCLLKLLYGTRSMARNFRPVPDRCKIKQSMVYYTWNLPGLCCALVRFWWLAQLFFRSATCMPKFRFLHTESFWGGPMQRFCNSTVLRLDVWHLRLEPWDFNTENTYRTVKVAEMPGWGGVTGGSDRELFRGEFIRTSFSTIQNRNSHIYIYIY